MFEVCTFVKFLINSRFISLHTRQPSVNRYFYSCAHLYGRGSHRKSTKRLVASSDSNRVIPEAADYSPPLDETYNKECAQVENTQLSKSSKPAMNVPLPFSFVKLEKNDRRLSEAMMIVKSRKLRTKAGLILLEGKRLIQDALQAGAQPSCFFFSRSSDIVDIDLPTGDAAVPVYKTFYKDLQLWSDVVTSPGVFGIFKIPSPNVVNPPEESMPLTIICDNIRDPGNLGSILRVAAGVGSSKVILTKGCTDLWSTKVLRSAAGAHFRIPIVNSVDWHEMDRHAGPSNHIFLADNKEKINLNQSFEGDEELEDDKDLSSLFSNFVPYFSVDYVQKSPIVVILGGETHGLSREAFHFSRFQESCKRISIPLFNSVESLNSSIALSIITYEIQRQFILKNNSNNEMLVNGEAQS